MPNRSHLTAIHRKSLSVPTKYLLNKGLLVGRVLDFGCGHGFDCDLLGIDGYDPHWRDHDLVGEYDTIICNYVLNVLEESEHQAILDRILGLLRDGGRAYITVRTDKKSLNGWTTRGTYQCEVVLNLPLIHDGKFRMYLVHKTSTTSSMTAR